MTSVCVCPRVSWADAEAAIRRPAVFSDVLVSCKHSSSRLSAPSAPHHVTAPLLTWGLCWADRATERGSLSSSVSGVPKYTEDTLVFALIACNFIWLCDFALSLCYHSGGRSRKQVTWASINPTRLLSDWRWPARNQLKPQLFLQKCLFQPSPVLENHC